jgi:hypothetical protein
MALKRMIVELGMGTDLTGADYTKAAVRALKDASTRPRSPQCFPTAPLLSRSSKAGLKS